jgi:hypothetical protein
VKVATFRLGVLCLGCFFVLGLEGFCVLFKWDGRFATFNVDAMLTVLSIMALRAFSTGWFGLVCFWVPTLRGASLNLWKTYKSVVIH